MEHSQDDSKLSLQNRCIDAPTSQEAKCQHGSYCQGLDEVRDLLVLLHEVLDVVVLAGGQLLQLLAPGELRVSMRRLRTQATSLQKQRGKATVSYSFTFPAWILGFLIGSPNAGQALRFKPYRLYVKYSACNIFEVGLK